MAAPTYAATQYTAPAEYIVPEYYSQGYSVPQYTTGYNYAAPRSYSPYRVQSALAPVDIDGDGIADVWAQPGQPIIVRTAAATANTTESSGVATD